MPSRSKITSFLLIGWSVFNDFISYGSHQYRAYRADDIEKAVKEAAEFEAQDKARREAIDARNDADSFAFQTEKALGEVGDKLSDSEKAPVEADLADLKAFLDATKDQEMTADQVTELKAKKEKLTNSAQALFTKMYEQAQGAAGAAGAGPDMGAGMGGASTGGDDDAEGDVVDGDYREV